MSFKTTLVELHGGLGNKKVVEHDGAKIIYLEVFRCDGSPDPTMQVGMAIYELNEEGDKAFWSHNTWTPL